jgi:hypothetical protein
MKNSSDDKRGFYKKYIISKADGSPVDPKAVYMVLRLDTDKAARAAAIEYAMVTVNHKLKCDIENLVRNIVNEHKDVFDCAEFFDEDTDESAFAVSMEKYTVDQVLGIFKKEFGISVMISDLKKMWVSYGVGHDYDDEKLLGWWLDSKPIKGSCPVWVCIR